MMHARLIGLGSVGLALVLLMMGYAADEGEGAYLFPNILSLALLLFAVIYLFTEAQLMLWLQQGLRRAWQWFFTDRVDFNVNQIADVIRLIPAFIILFLYLFLADVVGLYTMSFLAFLAIVTVYTLEKPRVKYFPKYVLIAALFTAVIYLIFAVMLQLQTPSALLL